jgi:hypothetical protein
MTNLHIKQGILNKKEYDDKMSKLHGDMQEVKSALENDSDQ